MIKFGDKSIFEYGYLKSEIPRYIRVGPGIIGVNKKLAKIWRYDMDKILITMNPQRPSKFLS